MGNGQISDLISKILGQQNSGPRRRTARGTQPQTDEQRGNRTCALTARGSISEAMKGLVGGAAQGFAACRRNWTAALIPRSSGTGTHPTSAESAEAERKAWRGGSCKPARSAKREQGRSSTGIASLPHVKLSPMSALGPICERQEHLDAVVSFAGCDQRRRLFRGFDILTIKWANGRLAGRVPMFLKKEKGPTSKQLEVTTDPRRPRPV